MKSTIPTTIYHTTGGLQEKLSGELTMSTREYLNYIDLEIKEIEKIDIDLLNSKRELMKLKRELEQELDNE